METFNTEAKGAGRDHGKKRKIDPDGFVCPKTPEIFKKHHFANQEHSTEVPGHNFEENRPDEDTSTECFIERDDSYYISDHQLIGDSEIKNGNETLQDPDRSRLQAVDGESNEHGSMYTQRQQNKHLVDGRPTEDGDASTNPVGDEIAITLKRWKEKREHLIDYWSNIFRMSQEYEEKTSAKLNLLMSQAQDLDRKVQQKRRNILERVKNIGHLMDKN